MFMVLKREELKSNREVEDRIIIRYLLMDNLLRDLGDYIYYSSVWANSGLYKNRRIIRNDFRGSMNVLDDHIARLRVFIRDDLDRLCRFEAELIDACFDDSSIYRYDGEDTCDLADDKERTIRAFCYDNERMVEDIKEKSDLKLIKSYRNLISDSIELAKTNDYIQLRSAGYIKKYCKSSSVKGIFKGVL